MCFELHNPFLYERARDMAGHVAQAMKQASPGCILLYAPALDRHLEAMAELAYPGLLLLRYAGAGPTAKAEASRRSWQARPLGRPSHEVAPVAQAAPDCRTSSIFSPEKHSCQMLLF